MKLVNLGTIFISFFISVGLGAFLLLVYDAKANRAKQPVMTQASSLSIRTAELSEAHTSVADKELPERTEPSYSERVRNRVIILDLQEQRLRALTRGVPLSEWVKHQFVTFETAEEKGLAFERSVGWGVGWYKGDRFDWFAYTSPYGILQVNMSLPMSKEDMGKIRDSGHLDVRPANKSDIPGTATHLALSKDGTTWVEEYCITNSSVCNTAGALEKYFLPKVDKTMPEKLLFFTNGHFPY